MSKKLASKVALATGGNSGIGLAFGKLFLGQGAKVVVTARSRNTFKKASAELGRVFAVVQADVSKLLELDRLYSRINKSYGDLRSSLRMQVLRSFARLQRAARRDGNGGSFPSVVGFKLRPWRRDHG